MPRIGARHMRFLLALLIGAASSVASHALPLAIEARLLVGVDVACAVYLVLMLRFARRTDARELARLAGLADEGARLMLVIAVAVVVLGLVSIFRVLADNAATGLPTGLLALAAVPLGWGTIQVMAAFHYARLFYRGGTADDGTAGDGLAFPGEDPPGPVDFLYFSFGVAMTAQVADVAVTTSAMRRTVLVHSTASFFFNTVILALAVNAAVILGQG